MNSKQPMQLFLIITILFIHWCKDKGKFHRRTGHKGSEWEQRYSSTPSLTSALDGVSGQHHVLTALPPPPASPYPLIRRLGGPQSWSGWVRKISPPPGFDPRAVQPVASRYTDWAISAPYKHKVFQFCVITLLYPNKFGTDWLHS
jgi:hypothetical protein